jgi:glutathione S-transferase
LISLYGHRFSSFTWKALIAFYEKDIPFDFRTMDESHPEHVEVLERLTPVGKFPLIVDGERAVFEATAIIEYLEVLHPASPLIPPGVAGAEVRMLDRVFDLHVSGAMQATVDRRLGRASEIDAARGLATLDRSYPWLDARLSEAWVAGEAFTLADCAAAPALFYADWIHPIPDALPRLRAYRARLLERPSVARCVEDARPFRHLMPGGAPDRD